VRAVRRFAVLALGALLPVLAAATTAEAATPPGFTLSTTQPGGSGFAPAFVGNGYLAGRQPAAGQGFGNVQIPGRVLPTQSEVQGFYAEVSQPDTGLIERRAALPAWSTLRYAGPGGAFRLDQGHVDAYRQTLDLFTGTLTTRVTWTSPTGKTVGLRYDVTPDRAHPHAAVVRLRLRPQFSGEVTVSDVLDGRAAEWVRAAGGGHDATRQWVDLKTQGLGVRATEASVLTGPGKRTAHSAEPLSATQSRTLDVHAGSTYTFVKAVGVAVSTDDAAPGTTHDRALRAAAAEAGRGYAGARFASDREWAELWRSDIRVAGDARLQRQVRASMFSLLASLRDDVPWAPSPGGLSSDGYNGHVFWDSETWMYPSMLATEPAIARQMLRYRFDRLDAARANARRTGYLGARFPWESALSGGEETPSCCDTGKYEVHVNADIALAMRQYWLATGDRAWLRRQAWPVVSGIADFWVSRARQNTDGSWSINHVIPPDEYADGVDDSVYTNVTARDALRIAADIAAKTGHAAKPAWAQVADGLRILPPEGSPLHHPEFHGYHGQTVKQADITLLSYPWEEPQSDALTQSDLDYYVPRTDPNGPSMTDAIHSIVTSQLGTPGCAAFTFTRRSVDPFMRGPYDQFSEARTGGAFTFTTGAGGFLQEFLYGYSGMRWRGDAVRLDPSLPPQLDGVTLRAVHWRGRTLRIAIRRTSTHVELLDGPALTVRHAGEAHRLPPGATLTLPTRRPDLRPTADVARCRPATALPATAEPPEAAVDGTATTSWLAEEPGTRVTVDLGRTVALDRIDITRPPVLAIPSATPGENAITGPVHSAAEEVRVSADGRTWHRLAAITTPGAHDVIDGSGEPVRYVRVRAGDDATAQHPLVVGDLAVRAAP
jgi:trehalose/maltose hydrolase-like predicted phosphorylase